MGTMAWMAPEMLSSKKYDESVDVYAFAVVMCESRKFCYSLFRAESLAYFRE